MSEPKFNWMAIPITVLLLICIVYPTMRAVRFNNFRSSGEWEDRAEVFCSERDFEDYAPMQGYGSFTCFDNWWEEEYRGYVEFEWNEIYDWWWD